MAARPVPLHASDAESGFPEEGFTMHIRTRVAAGALTALAVAGCAAARGTFHAATLPDGDMQITAMIDAGQQ